MEALGAPRSLAQVQRDLITAGYDGESFVFLVPTDLTAVSAISDVAAEVLCKLGMNMDYQILDWAAVAQRLNSQEPLNKVGGILPANYASGFSPMSPAGHGRLPGLGHQSLVG